VLSNLDSYIFVTNYIFLQVEGECIDGNELRIKLLAEEDISKKVVSSLEDESAHLGLYSVPVQSIPDSLMRYIAMFDGKI